MMKKILAKNWPLILSVLYFSLFYFRFISFVTADLGRHIVNGREILVANSQILNGNQSWNTMKVLNENYYSYTQPNFPFPNHHWLFGVGVYLVEKSFGFSGLTFLNALFYVGAFTFALILAKKKSNVKFAVITGLIAIPLITHRTEVRPEALSLFLFSGYFFILDLISNYFDREKKGWRNLTNWKNKLIFWKKTNNHLEKIFLPLVITILLISQIIWTNSHLFFIFGPFIAGLFFIDSFLENILNKKSISKKTKFLFLITLGLLGATIINPHGMSGSLNPLHIFDNYGYKVAENQSIWFMIGIKNQIVKYGYFIAAAILGLVSFFGKINFGQKTKKTLNFFTNNFFSLSLLLTFGIMTQFINRTSSFFGIILIPILAQNLFFIFKNYRKKIKKILDSSLFLMILSPIVVGTIVLLLSNGLLFPPTNKIGMGLTPSMSTSAEFFKNAKLSGPIFNNYDLGGYLIYHLFPEQKVFVDNRPESYSEDFFENEYISAQENEGVWGKISNKYNFETIYFFRLDQTDWAQKFLHKRVLDKNWVPVYVDSYILIFVKNNENNKEIIEKYELPKEIFSFTELNRK